MSSLRQGINELIRLTKLKDKATVGAEVSPEWKELQKELVEDKMAEDFEQVWVETSIKVWKKERASFEALRAQLVALTA